MDAGRYFDAHELERFRRDGYVVVPGLFGPGALSRIEAWTREVAGMPEVPGRHMVYYEDCLSEPGRRVLSRIENFCPYHPGFEALLADGELLARVSELFAEPAVLFKEKINFKLPGGGGFQAHQDVQAGWDAYATLHITVLVSIDAATAENGCLELVPGAHTRGLIGEKWKPLAEDESPELRFVASPTQPGDAVFFDSFVPHRSGPNLSDSPRRVLYVTYNRLSEGDHRARYYADKRRSYPPDCEREAGTHYTFRV
ncbi:MAG: phytanoyl-CoA dioxygenase family protein [Gammaproteobacteria bacterium]|nr:phytanoyl-CoA dioxygenase family protein [Gammaproteobacteria bacterium]NIR83050.1 phytanoyl-CoA dioxygenase family protein [Gammaproteobacteria bacterium]NIR90712.1 phytanoyl-CoA dioxygenase family protein [Gammaproteobacteria bacterium]NIU04203.1 phytanoyl-CoA dioxygenase family protein [Gammaproteobacteria bacterium]NIV51495.1 phytanoyl-CoA dioxygenase family protein [Gammaproteobacteria bacterium]